MKIVIPDDYQDAVRGLACFSKLAGHTVTVYNDTVKDVDALAARLASAEVLVLIRERTVISEALLARLPRLRMISQTGKGVAHIDLEACARRGITVATGTGSPYAPAELTWALLLAAARCIPREVAGLKAGGWQSTLGVGLRGRTLGIWGYGKIGQVVAGYGRAFGMKVLAWGAMARWSGRGRMDSRRRPAPRICWPARTRCRCMSNWRQTPAAWSRPPTWP